MTWERQLRRLKDVRRERDQRAVQRALSRLEEEAKGSQNLIPCLIETVKTYASIGEIMDTLKGVFGLYQEPLVI
jgi:methylmalonyl-CoA mutase N-terminal domain/subunit